MMKKLVLVFAAFALVLTACSGDDSSQVATLEDTTGSGAVASDEVDVAAENEDAILEFSQCMRDNGVEDFEDPEIGDDGEIAFRFGGLVQDTEIDRDTMRAAFEACQDHLEGLAFGPGSIDRSEIEDTMLEFAVCMRDKGVDVPDPDFSNLGPGGGGDEGEGGVFGGAIDLDDPAVAAALEECQEIFGGSLRFGGSGGRDNG